MKKYGISVLAAALLFSGSALGAQFSLNPAADTVPVASAAGAVKSFVLAYDNTGTTADSVQARVQFDKNQVGVTAASSGVGNASCYALSGADDDKIEAVNFVLSGPLPSGDLCTLTVTLLGQNNGVNWAAGDEIDLQIVYQEAGDAGADVTGDFDPPQNAKITLIDQGPPTITIDDTDVTLTSPAGAFAGAQSDPATIAVGLIDGGQAGATAGYSCSGTGTQAPFSFAPASQGPFEDGDQGDVQDITVSCTMANAAVTGSVSCTRTGGDTTLVEFDVTCPAAPNPPLALDPTPPSGTTLNAPGGGTATITVGQEDGNTGESGDVTCTSDNPLITIAPAGTQTINFGDADFDFTVTIPGGEAGTITCTGTDPATAGNNGFTWTYPVSGVYAPPPHLVPATSLWSKLALFGLFGALGMLILGLRRSH